MYDESTLIRHKLWRESKKIQKKKIFYLLKNINAKKKRQNKRKKLTKRPFKRYMKIKMKRLAKITKIFYK